MNEIITRESINELTNTNLKKDLRNMSTALETIGRNTWKYAEGVYNIVTSESYKDDFETAKKLADFVGMSESNLSKTVRAYSLHRLKTFDTLSMSKVQELLILTLDELQTFVNELGENDLDVAKSKLDSMTVKELRQAIKAFKNRNDSEEIDETDGEGTGEQDSNVELFVISMNGDEYQVTEDIYNKVMELLEV